MKVRRKTDESSPFSVTVQTTIKARVSHERRGGVNSAMEWPVGLDSNLSLFLQWAWNKVFYENDIIAARGRLFKVGVVDPIMKFGGVHCYQAPLTPAGFESEWAQSVSISGATPVTIATAATSQFVATVLPSTASNKGVVWESSNEAVATVDTDGLVTGVSIGTATIMATAIDGGFTATRGVEVVAP